MSRARSVADLGNQNVLDLNASAGTLKVGAGATIENTGEVQFAGIVTAATVQIGAATTLHATGLDLGSGNITSHNITSTGNLSVDGNMDVGGVLTYEDVTSVDSIGIITARAGLHVTGAGSSLGIGTNDPQDKLHIYSTSTNLYSNSGILTAAVSVYNSASQTGSYSALKFRTENDNGASSLWYVGGVSKTANYQGDLFFSCRTGENTYGERVRITSAGNVGIGTDNPNEELHIHANGTSYIRFTDESSGTGSTDGAVFGLDNPHLYAWNYEAGDFVVATNATEKLRVTSDGQLQATGAADVRLTLGSGGTAGTNDSVHVRADGANLMFMNANAGITKFEQNGTEAMQIDANGVFRVNASGTINGSARPKLFVRTASSTDTTDIIAKLGNNNSQASSEAVIAMSAGYSLTANDTEGHVYFGALREGTGNRSGFIVKTWDGTTFNRHFRVDSSGGTNILRTQNGGTHDNSNALDNWWRIGEFRNVSMGWRGHLTLMGAQSYSAGANTSGHTVINLCIVNNNTVTGHFYGVSGGTGTVKGVATAYNASTDILEIWVQPVTSYAGFGVLPNASYGGWYADNTNTGSSTQPAGTTALSSHVIFQTYGVTALTVDTDRNIRLSRAGLTVYIRNSATCALIGSENLPVTLVACTTDGGTNIATVYWAQNYGANQNQGCLGAVTATDTIVSPSTSVSSGHTIYGFVGRL